MKRPYALTYLVPGPVAGRADGRDARRTACYATETSARRGLATLRREHPDWTVLGLWRGLTSLPLDRS